VGLVVDKVALGQVFSEYFGFPCQSLFHQFLIQGWYNRPLVAAVPKVPPHKLKKNWTDSMHEGSNIFIYFGLEDTKKKEKT
jgi:hypothetical protein